MAQQPTITIKMTPTEYEGIVSMYEKAVKLNAAAQEAEEKAKAESQYLLYYIANPKQEGINISAYSLVEAAMGLYDKLDRTVVVFDLTDIDNPHVVKAMKQCEKVLKKRFPDAKIFGTVEEAVTFFSKV